MKAVVKMFRANSLLLNLILMAVLGLVVFFFMQYQKTSYTSYNTEGFSLIPTKAHYYYMDGCGHCKDFSPIWDEFTKSYKGKVKFQKINMKDAEEDLKKYDIDGFPTVVIIDNNNLQSATSNYETHPTLTPIDKKFKSFGWEVENCNGHNQSEIINKIKNKDPLKPLVLVAKTIKGYPISFMSNKPIWHYRSPNKDEYKQAIKELNEK